MTDISSESGSSGNETGGDQEFVCSVVLPYQNEPLAVTWQGIEGQEAEVGDEADDDGIPLRAIEMRYNGTVVIDEW